MGLKNNKTYFKSQSWLQGKDTDDDKLVEATNNIFLPALEKAVVPELFFLHGADKMYKCGSILIDFEKKKVHPAPEFVLFQRTSSTLTFDCAFIKSGLFFECAHVEAKYLPDLVEWCEEHGIRTLNSGADPIPVKWVVDSLVDLSYEEVVDLINPSCSSDSDSDWCLSPPRKRKLADRT